MRGKHFKISHVLKIGPKKVSPAGKGLSVIYLPKSLSWLRGKHVFLTIEVIEQTKLQGGAM